MNSISTISNNNSTVILDSAAAFETTNKAITLDPTIGNATKAANVEDKAVTVNSENVVLAAPGNPVSAEMSATVVDYLAQNTIPLTTQSADQLFKAKSALSATVVSYATDDRNQYNLSASQLDQITTVAAKYAIANGVELTPEQLDQLNQALKGVPQNIDPVIASLAILIQMMVKLFLASNEQQSTAVKMVADAANSQGDELRKSGGLGMAGAVIGGAASIGIGAYGLKQSIGGAKLGVEAQKGQKQWQTHDAQTERLQAKVRNVEVEFRAERDHLARTNPNYHVRDPDIDPVIADPARGIAARPGRVGGTSPEERLASKFQRKQIVAEEAVTNHELNNAPRRTKDQLDADTEQSQKLTEYGRFNTQILGQSIGHGVRGSFEAGQNFAQANSVEDSASLTLSSGLIDMHSKSKDSDLQLSSSIINAIRDNTQQFTGAFNAATAV